MALAHKWDGWPELRWRPTRPVTTSTRGCGPSVGRSADVPGRKCCSTLATRPRALLPHALQGPQPECQPLLPQEPPASRRLPHATPAPSSSASRPICSKDAPCSLSLIACGLQLSLLSLLGMPWAPTSNPQSSTQPCSFTRPASVACKVFDKMLTWRHGV